MFASCKDYTNPSFESSIDFELDTLVVEGGIFPEDYQSFRYSTYSLGADSVPFQLHYVLDDSLLLSFALDGTERRLIPIPPLHSFPLYSIASNDSYLFFSEYEGHLYICHNEGFKLDRQLNDLSILKRDAMALHPMHGFNSGISVLNDSVLLLPIASNNSNQGKYGRIDTKSPMFALYHLLTKETTYLNCWLPDHFLKYDHHTIHLRQSTLKGDTIFIHYPYRDSIDLFSVKQNKRIATHSFKSQYQTEVIRGLQPRERKQSKIVGRYEVESGHYGSFIYNPFLNCYYRIFYHALPTKNDQHEFTIYSDKSSSIAVYDELFRFMGEYKFERGKPLFLGVSPTKEGVLLNSNLVHGLSELKILHLKHNENI